MIVKPALKRTVIRRVAQGSAILFSAMWVRHVGGACGLVMRAYREMSDIKRVIIINHLCYSSDLDTRTIN